METTIMRLRTGYMATTEKIRNYCLGLRVKDLGRRLLGLGLWVLGLGFTA